MNRNLNCSYMTINSISALSLTALLIKHFKLTIAAFKFIFSANYYSVDLCWLWKLRQLIQMKKITLKYSWSSQIRWNCSFCLSTFKLCVISDYPRKCQKYFLSMCDLKVFLTFTFVVKILQVTLGCWWRWFTIDVPPSSLNLVLLWQLFYLFCSSIVINTVIVTAGTFEP